MNEEPKRSKKWCNDLNICASYDSIIYQNHIVKVIRDKFPKAKHHYLILPNFGISSVSNLNSSHVQLLCHLHQVAEQIICQTNLPKEYFKVGYHAVPSMVPLHLHVISKDFISPCLKTKIHWGTFTTDFFIPSELAIKVLCERGTLLELIESVKDKAGSASLKCHVCRKEYGNMPLLKTHLLRHEFLYANEKATVL